MRKLLVMSIALASLFGNPSQAAAERWEVGCEINKFVFDLSSNRATHYLGGYPIARGEITRKGPSSSEIDFALATFGRGLYMVGINLSRDPFIYVNRDGDSHTICQAELLSLGKPDLVISGLNLSPSTPTQGRRVLVRVEVANTGNEKAGAFTVEWWAGENFPEPGCTWRVTGLDVGENKRLTCTYDGYPSWYSRINTKVVADSKGEIDEEKEANNQRLRQIRVQRD